MNTRAEFTKLAELRSKTDRQLVTYISSRLDLALASTDTFRADAEGIYEEVSSLMACVNGVSRVERRRLESKIEQLRQLVNASAIHAGMRVHAACS